MELVCMGMSAFRFAKASWGAAFAMMISVPAGAEAISRPEPSDPNATVPALGYESAFKGYRTIDDQPVASWRAANDLARQLGGWKAFASDKVPEISESAADRGTTPKSVPREVPASGSGHAGHGNR